MVAVRDSEGKQNDWDNGAEDCTFVSRPQTYGLWSANIWFSHPKPMVYQSQTYGLGLLTLNYPFLNRFLQNVEG